MNKLSFKLLVNLVGYGGTCVIYAVLYSAEGGKGWEQKAAFLLWSVHFIKRCLECVWVHKWSEESLKVPWLMAIGEWIYYLGFALWIGYENNCMASSPVSLLGFSFGLQTLFSNFSGFFEA